MIIGVFCGLYGLGVLLIIGTSHWFNFFGLIIGVCLQVLALMLPYAERLPIVMKSFILVISTFCIAFFFLSEIAIVWEGMNKPKAGADYVIILGAKVEGFEPSLALKYRIEAAAGYMIENCESVALATGGQGIDECISEAEVIAKGLIALGVEPSRILIESESTSTKENFSYGLRVIEKAGGSTTSCIVIVSSKYHVLRAKKLAEAVGYKNISTTGCPSMNYLIPHYYAREFVALIKEKWDGNI